MSSELSTPSTSSYPSPILSYQQAFDKDVYYDRTCDEYLNFTSRNPTTYHVTNYFKKVLRLLGFHEISEKEPFSLNREGGLYFTTRDEQTIVAFVLGGGWTPEQGVGAIGCHGDALTAKVKPVSIKDRVHGYELLGVAPYSGALSHLWLDRDLGIAGAVHVRRDGQDSVERVLISSGQQAVARIPSLAPHFGAKSNVPYNKETQMVPVIGFGTSREDASEDEKKSALFGKHPLSLLRYVALLARVRVSDLEALDLELFDVQTATRGGINDDFMFAPRIDDRLCSYTAINALITHARSALSSLNTFKGLSVAYIANNEEIGSSTRTGAEGNFFRSVIERIISTKSNNTAADTALAFANSVILSADVTHLLNPNFQEAYLENHFPVPNKGLTIKKDPNGHVVSDSIGILLLEKIAQLNDLELQQFHVRNDMPSGSTIGPYLATGTGARVVDVGLSQLSMHSIRAAAGYKEVGIGIETFYAFYKTWREVYDKFH